MLDGSNVHIICGIWSIICIVRYGWIQGDSKEEALVVGHFHHVIPEGVNRCDCLADFYVTD